MKEFQSTQGGRHVYNTDFKNLQELALAMQEIFRACGGNFVISGCKVTDGTTLSVAAGYVYIDGKVRAVKAASGLSASNLYIVAAQKNGDSIPYADGGNSNQYIEYYATVQNATSTSAANIAYNSTTKSFPNLATVFFNYYAVCKKADNQSIDSLSVLQSLTASKTFMASQGVNIGGTNYGVFQDGGGVALKAGNYSLSFSNTGVVSLKQNGSTLLSFSNASGAGTVTYENVTVSQDLKAKKIYLDGVDIENKLVPLGVIQMWAGSIDKLPDNYKLCDGTALKQTDYPELYKVIGTIFNTGPNASYSKWVAPSSGMFRLPDLRGRFIAGYYSADDKYQKIGNSGGEVYHTLKTGELPAHSHSVDDYYGLEDAKSVSGAQNAGNLYGNKISLSKSYFGWAGNDVNNSAMMYYTHDSGSTGGGTPFENRPPFYVLAYIMRVK